MPGDAEGCGAGHRRGQGSLERRVGSRALGAERRAHPVGAHGAGDADWIAGLETALQRGAAADAQRAAHAVPRELAQHRGGAGGADPGRLDRELEAVGGAARIPPETVVVVGHQRLVEDPLRERQGESGIGGEQGVGGDRRRGAEVGGQGPRIMLG